MLDRINKFSEQTLIPQTILDEPYKFVVTPVYFYQDPRI